MTEPVTLAEAKVSARIDDDETGLDDYISTAITAARQQAEHLCGRRFVPDTQTVELEDWPAETDILRVPEPASVAVTYWNGTAWVALASLAYSWEAYRGGTLLWTSGTWPTLGDKPGIRVRVEVDTGASEAAAECVKLYILASVSAWVNNPDAQQRQALQPNPLFERLLDPVRQWR